MLSACQLQIEERIVGKNWKALIPEGLKMLYFLLK